MENTTAKIRAKEVRKALVDYDNYAILSAYNKDEGLTGNAVRTKHLAHALERAGYRCAIGVYADGALRLECLFVLDIPLEALFEFALKFGQYAVIHEGVLFERNKKHEVGPHPYHQAAPVGELTIFDKDAPKPEGGYSDVAGVRFTLKY